MRNTLKQLMAEAILSLPMMMNAQTVRSITFAVDGKLKPVEDRYKLTFSGQDVAISILAEDTCCRIGSCLLSHRPLLAVASAPACCRIGSCLLPHRLLLAVVTASV